MINLFGLTIEPPQVKSDHFIKKQLSEVAKRSEEKQILRDFIMPKMPEILAQAEAEVTDISADNSLKSKVASFYLQELKSSGAYENMVLKTIAADPKSSSPQTARDILNGRQVTLPSTFPGDHKRAESLVTGAITSSISHKEVKKFKMLDQVKSKVKAISHDLFYALNHGLNQEQAKRFIGVTYEIDQLKTADIVNPKMLKSNLENSIKTGEPFNLVHVKCLRFVYPKSGGVSILPDTKDTKIEGINGPYTPHSEINLFDHLKEVQHVFENHDIPSNFHILLSDEDLDTLFPPGHPIVTQEQIQQAKSDAAEYYRYIQQNYPDFNYSTINELADDPESGYESFRQEVIGSLHTGNGRFMSPNFFEKDRVDYQYEHYQERFGPLYDRDEATISVRKNC